MNYRDFFSKKGAVNKDIKTLIPEGVSLKEFYKGVAIEKESVGDEFAAAKLAKGNLEKDAEYYTKLHGDTDDEAADAECGADADTSGDEYDDNGGLPLVGGALAVPHLGQPIKLGKIVQVGAEFGHGPATGELSGMTAMGGGGCKGVAKDAGGLPVKTDGDKEPITAGGKTVDSSIATKSVGGNVVPGEGQKQGGPNSSGTIAGTSKLTESKDKVRRIVKQVLKEITFDEKSGKWVRITEATKPDEEPECDGCGRPESECECMPESVDMKMGASYKTVQPRQYKVSDDDFARTNQYEPEITEMYDEEEESIMNERYISLVNASRNLSESELSEMKTLREKLERLGEKTDNWIQKAVNPAHKGYCTPMTKATCTPARKALAKRFKHHDLEENTAEMKMGPSYKVVAPTQARVQSDDQARDIQFDPELTEAEGGQQQGQWRQNGGNGFSFIVSGKELARVSKAIGNKFIVAIGGKEVGTVQNAEQGKTYVEDVYYGKGKGPSAQQSQAGAPQGQPQPALAENDDAGAACPECGNAEGNNELNPQENPHGGGGSAICGKCGHAWNTTDEDGNKVDTHKLDPVEEIGGMAVQHRSYRTANDDHQIPKARWSDEVYEGMSQVAKTIKKGMKPKKTKKPSSKKK